MEYYLAIDIGASSGRHMLGYLEHGVLKTEEIYRFENGITMQNGHLCWDLKRLYKEIIQGMKRCKELNKIPSSIGIDTWAVDFVLLDEQDQMIADAISYRDNRTEHMDQEVEVLLSEQALYERTGIQKQSFNTIYQLMAIKKKTPQAFEKAHSFLMIPDYFCFLLTGKKQCEYTNATTTQLVNLTTGNWDEELLDLLGYPKTIFPDIIASGTCIGRLRKAIVEEIGYDCNFILTATHDTASAVVSVPMKEENALYISSGTWSLMGLELKEACVDERSRKANMTNEGGYGNRYRYLKNIMGLWMMQNIRKEYHNAYDFQELCILAAQHKEFPSIIDVNDAIFLAPEHMVRAIQDYCEASGQRIPQTVGELAQVVYASLAYSYAQTKKELEAMSKQTYSAIYIVGGGSQAEYLNQLTADACKCVVYCGPKEATAIGNIMVQMIQNGACHDLHEARRIIRKSCEIKKYEENNHDM